MDGCQLGRKILENLRKEDRLIWYKIGRAADRAYGLLQVIVLMALVSYFIFIHPITFQPVYLLWISLSPMAVLYFSEIFSYEGTEITSAYTLYNKSFVAFGIHASTSARNYFILNIVFTLIHSLATVELFILHQIPILDLVLIMTVHIANIFIDITKRKAMSNFYHMTNEAELHKAHEIIERIKTYCAHTPKAMNKYHLFNHVPFSCLLYLLLILFVIVRIILVHFCKKLKSATYEEELWIFVALAGPIAASEVVNDFWNDRARVIRRAADRLYYNKRFVAFGTNSTNFARLYLLLNIIYSEVISTAAIVMWMMKLVPTFDMISIVFVNSLGICLHVLLRYRATKFYNFLASRHFEMARVQKMKKGKTRTTNTNDELSVPLKQKER